MRRAPGQEPPTQASCTLAQVYTRAAPHAAQRRRGGGHTGPCGVSHAQPNLGAPIWSPTTGARSTAVRTEGRDERPVVVAFLGERRHRGYEGGVKIPMLMACNNGGDVAILRLWFE